ncbi:hypothetical protein [Burkholderia contaminans]|uniref:hypothetical protein n=1 Tax=Burkholderia contaminans TaxID=488447 RepID=UPI001364C951|nr:hypothetical protein [Burkholderia contaminans]MEB4636785.1 hypothetical protein [Burkholderia contaminans]MEB4651672.1 hypothetical protein [Burkholderia contaminans]MEB4661243.1 hypothetical protein [Burkholderia contaminans]MEB4667147.1 hypothetical protein [Burkholderia contaminans]MEB4678473.1 hypothetical protein [Burkholderia contaminans]
MENLAALSLPIPLFLMTRTVAFAAAHRIDLREAMRDSHHAQCFLRQPIKR